MTFVEVVLRYQTYNSATGRFDVVRSGRDYAQLLGVHPQRLRRVARGEQDFNLTVARALARTFPEARDLLADLVLPTARVAQMDREPLPLSDLPEAQKIALARWVMRCLARIEADDRAAAAATPVLSVHADASAPPEPGGRSSPRRPTSTRQWHR